NTLFLMIGKGGIGVEKTLPVELFERQIVGWLNRGHAISHHEKDVEILFINIAVRSRLANESCMSQSDDSRELQPAKFYKVKN
ncbi:MAG: hypothetical protein K0U41_09860, partial [Gammaproteobacteria bacterium]|nr:hypothetical protein [Gammaproteobacteria bacterium]